MTEHDTDIFWQGVIAQIREGNFTLVKQAVAECRSDASKSPAKQAFLEMLDSGALDRLIADKETLAARTLARRVIAAAKVNDRNTAQGLALELRDLLSRTGVALDDELAFETLNRLRNVRAFQALARLGDRLVSLGLGEPRLHRVLAQGLIENGYTKAAVCLLEGMFSTTSFDDKERLDGLGLAGRAHKQIYMDVAHAVNGGKTASLRASLIKSAACYEDAYIAARGRLNKKFDEWSYHGINLIAIAARAKKDGITLPLRVSPDLIRKEIISEYKNLEEKDRTIWDTATAGEAYIAEALVSDAATAEEKWKLAAKLLEEYAVKNEIDAFKLAGTLRQLQEVWQLDPKDKNQGAILYFLNAQLLAKEGGHVLLSPDDRDQLIKSEPSPQTGSRLEVYLSDGRPKPLHWLRTGLDRANSVGLVQLKSNKEGFGTGFLVRAGDFIAHMGEESVFLTNAHVISSYAIELNDPHVPAKTLDEAQVEFTVAGHGVERRVFDFDRILWESPRSELDACLIALKQPAEGIPVCQLSKKTPKPGKSRVIVIGHPGGEREMKLSLYDSPVTAFDEKGLLSAGGGSQKKRLYLRYTNPTIPGNSGSPVFDIDDWCVVGLHHAGSAAQSTSGVGGQSGQAHGNEGVFIHSIAEACRSNERPLVYAAPAQSAGHVQGVPRAMPEAVAAPLAEAANVTTQPQKGKLAHDIPLRMFERRPVVVTANISLAESEKLFEGLRGTASVHDVNVTAAMTVTLRSETGAFDISPMTPEKQWVDNPDVPAGATTWQWRVTPRRHGAFDLAIVLNGSQYRNGIEAALPASKEVINVRVQIDTSARAKSISKWAAVAAGSGALSLFAQSWLRPFM